MDSQAFGLIELLLVFGLILGWAGWQWWDWRRWRNQRNERDAVKVDESEPPPPTNMD